jgi:hypothetical protein
MNGGVANRCLIFVIYLFIHLLFIYLLFTAAWVWASQVLNLTKKTRTCHGLNNGCVAHLAHPATVSRAPLTTQVVCWASHIKKISPDVHGIHPVLGLVEVFFNGHELGILPGLCFKKNIHLILKVGQLDIQVLDLHVHDHQ